MTQETEAVAMDLNIVSCQTCDALFIESERRQTCPSCGGPPVGPYFQFVLDAAGLHQRDGAAPVAAQPPPAEEPAPEPEAPAATAPVEEEAPAAEGIALEPAEVLPLMVVSYLQDGEATENDLQTALTDLGADRDAAATAVGRLTAVRDLMHDLAGAGLEPVAEVEVEVSPEAAPELPSGDGNGSETV